MNLDHALTARENLFDEKHETACRLFNGFTEGQPNLVIDLYARTAVLYNYAKPVEAGQDNLEVAQQFLLNRLPWLSAIIVKDRFGLYDSMKQGRLMYGDKADRHIREHGVRYAVELTMNQDSSFYLDTRNLRRWIIDNLHGKQVLNTFAYTGSLGVAAYAGGAVRVIQTDLNRQFLNVAKTSYTLNGFPIRKPEFMIGDFWSLVNRLKRAGEQFDAVFLDPPFFAATKKGRVDLAHNSARLINKVRPLIRHGGYLVAINNALFVSGQAYLDTVQSVCADGHVSIEQFIPVPDDCVGYALDPPSPITDPAPFNHATKIIVLRIFHKR
ncbi:class I SAM-dependent methyltransferase [Anaerolineales bacterium HSG25]|nr:class I SAM-dependent methyltransferase [Anaerolineales bacterium HSG25]